MKLARSWKDFVEEGRQEALAYFNKDQTALLPPELIELNALSLRLPYLQIKEEFEHFQEENAQRLRIYINAGLKYEEVVELCYRVALLDSKFAAKLSKAGSYTEFKKLLVGFIRTARSPPTSGLRTTPIRETKGVLSVRSFLGESPSIRDNNAPPMLVLHRT